MPPGVTRHEIALIADSSVALLLGIIPTEIVAARFGVLAADLTHWFAQSMRKRCSDRGCTWLRSPIYTATCISQASGQNKAFMFSEKLSRILQADASSAGILLVLAPRCHNSWADAIGSDKNNRGMANRTCVLCHKHQLHPKDAALVCSEDLDEVVFLPFVSVDYTLGNDTAA